MAGTELLRYFKVKNECGCQCSQGCNEWPVDEDGRPIPPYFITHPDEGRNDRHFLVEQSQVLVLETNEPQT